MRLPSPCRRGDGGEVDQPGIAEVMRNMSASVVSHNLYDVFGVLRYGQGSAETPWRWEDVQLAEEGLRHLSSGLYTVPGVGVPTLWLPAVHTKDPCEVFLDACLQAAAAALATCLATVATLWLDCMKGWLRYILPPLVEACLKRCTFLAAMSAAMCLVIHAGSVGICWMLYRECVSQRGSSRVSLLLASTVPIRPDLRYRLSCRN
ncbi:MAG: hypothetical protein KatS3mg023_1947 [Armatimonadota bacterium]|nr:MAG: hypothetical protein KatS3mg023_1947 [Armatimonadota bacterium]